ncbi:Flagellar motor switch protein FliG [Rubripirellula amarantea]|uniref:Flagellar motor switch protein FliG n=1 Tax=Rubripirellula amarantea TaxID=2527999 RepID=A0A5C5WS65_9BACT|nr:hypothetical protein [Rubripirellula amarantea]TWT52995.1 Flagellar motor switch protein FliG [Rubripirellula amarantea]
MATSHAATRTANDRDAMLRRVAIVLSTLPAPMVAKLLGTIDPESKQALRRTMTSLSDVDPLERRRAVEAFKVSIVSQPSDPTSGHPSALPMGNQAGGMEPGMYSGTSVVKSNSLHSSDTSGSPLGFLNQVADQDLASLLVAEHPQAIAIVLASVRPEKAGAVLPLLPLHLRTVTLSRIGRMGDVDPATAQDLETHFRKLIDQNGIRSQSEQGKRKLDAILASMPSSASPEIAAVKPELTHAARPQGNVVEPPLPSDALVQESVPQRDAYAGRSDADVSAIDLTHRLRVVREEPEVASRPSTHSAGVDKALTPESPQSQVETFTSTDQIHHHLIGLTPIELCQSLGKVETKEAMLTLCGLPNPVAEAALAILPKDQAKIVRIKMANLSSLNLRDIDDAKERVALASLSLDSVRSRASRSSSSQPNLIAA